MQKQVSNEIVSAAGQGQQESSSFSAGRTMKTKTTTIDSNNVNVNGAGVGDRDSAGSKSVSSPRSDSEVKQSTAAGLATMDLLVDMDGDRNRLRRRNFSHELGMTRRCVCNLSQCASSNYMCKSERRVLEDGREMDAGCFIEELSSSSEGLSGGSESSSGATHHGVGVTESNGRVTSARRGCIEMLSREKQDLCSDHTGAPIQCCNKDMCNYPKTYYPPFNQNVHSNSNRLSFESNSGVQGAATPNLDHQVWLRAAVIAVPVCGLMILIVLIIVARRLLKSDDLDYKETTSSRSSNRNKAYNNYPGYPPHQHVKPVFLEPQEFLLPIESHCCCHNNLASSRNEADYPVHNLSGGGYPHVQNPSTNSGGETEELVQSVGPLSHCQCPSNLSDSGSYCGSPNNRPPAYPSPPFPLPLQQMPHPKKFNILTHLGLSRNSKETNSNSNSATARPYDV